MDIIAVFENVLHVHLLASSSTLEKHSIRTNLFSAHMIFAFDWSDNFFRVLRIVCSVELSAGIISTSSRMRCGLHMELC